MVFDVAAERLCLVVHVVLVDRVVRAASGRLQDRDRDQYPRGEDCEAGDEVGPAAA